MAEKKRGPGRPPGSKNKNSRTSSSRSAKSGSARTTAAPKTKQERIQDMQRQRHADQKVIDEIWALILIAVGVFFVFTVMTDSTGALGARVHDLCRGLFGIMAYVLPFFFIVAGLLLLFQKVQHISGRTTIFTILIFVNICVLNSCRFLSEGKLKYGFTDMITYYKAGVAGKHGGAVGMWVGSILQKAFGESGCIIIAVTMIIISILLVANTPISKWVTSVSNKREAKRLLREMEEAEARKVSAAVEHAALPDTDPVSGLRLSASKSLPQISAKPEEPIIDFKSKPAAYSEPVHTPVLTPAPKPESRKPSIFSAFTSREEKAKIEKNRKNILEVSKIDEPMGKSAAEAAIPEFGKGLSGDNSDIPKPVTYGLSNSYEKKEGFGLDGYDTMVFDGRKRKEKAHKQEKAEEPDLNLGTAAAVAIAEHAATESKYRAPKKRTEIIDSSSVQENKPEKSERIREIKKSSSIEDNVSTDQVAEELTAGFSGNSSASGYKLPGIDLLKAARGSKQMMSEYQLQQKADLLVQTLKSFNVDATILSVTQGASVTRYEVQPATGVKVSKITSLADDIALNLRAKSLRIEAPIPGKAAVGIEVENDKPSPVLIRELIDSDEFRNAESKLSFVVGKDISGKNIIADLKSMPHMLIAGATGSGKSVCINSIITSILYKATPNEVKLIMIDPKVVELGNYNGIPHLLTSVVTDPRKASRALAEAVVEMNKRYEEFAKYGVKDLESYNELMMANQEPQNKKPQVVIIIDELADLMMAAPSQVEESICRLAQKARAAGMHLIVATQRPSVDVVTGLIKANVPSRIAFSVASQIDSRTILDMAGAEKLLGKGDMLFSPVGSSKPYRVQGPFISETETAKVIDFVKNQAKAEYNEELSNAIEGSAESKAEAMSDELTEDAIAFILKSKSASDSMLQRRFRIGYNRAARIIDEIEAMGIIGPPDGSRGRQVLVTEEEYFGGGDDAEEAVEETDTSTAADDFSGFDSIDVEYEVEADDDGVPEEISRYNEIIG